MSDIQQLAFAATHVALALQKRGVDASQGTGAQYAKVMVHLPTQKLFDYHLHNISPDFPGVVYREGRVRKGIYVIEIISTGKWVGDRLSAFAKRRAATSKLDRERAAERRRTPGKARDPRPVSGGSGAGRKPSARPAGAGEPGTLSPGAKALLGSLVHRVETVVLNTLRSAATIDDLIGAAQQLRLAHERVHEIIASTQPRTKPHKTSWTCPRCGFCAKTDVEARNHRGYHLLSGGDPFTPEELNVQNEPSA